MRKNGDDENRSDVGLVYIFELENGLWVEKAQFHLQIITRHRFFRMISLPVENYLTIGTTGVGNGGFGICLPNGTGWV